MNSILLIYLIVINAWGFIRMGQDKRYAKKSRQRVPEKQLFLIALLGGAAGGWIGMRVWHHKTKHRSFILGIPLLFIVNAVVVYLIVRFLK
ncbi:Uncharacterized membrane protein YsdA, DUF1294 family [Paenibacillus sp. 1_12]|uniref:DUF1294 domain-containing protein n=1 Tax=Paenibacillus sp. 1_12 TaxID=1566278 RepID=UPI0008E4A472|nr:DUF1294 domain-containing protein [Paenibacillus sp. 1_12]SFM20535.1 Uncharacterized membrane protein YsdA, DUF1294 family [Paenibacillus sp. 1_12]